MVGRASAWGGVFKEDREAVELPSDPVVQDVWGGERWGGGTLRFSKMGKSNSQ